VTDGSYKKKIMPALSGAGWVVYCMAYNNKRCGNFFSPSTIAGFYLAELLGLLVIHAPVAAITELYKAEVVTTRICCDNQGALFKFK